MIELITTYASIWAPSLVAILGTIVTVLTCTSKTQEAFNKLDKDTILKDVRNKLDKVLEDNIELKEHNKMLLDELTKIKNYADTKKESRR